jgi:hypothetical protein
MACAEDFWPVGETASKGAYSAKSTEVASFMSLRSCRGFMARRPTGVSCCTSDIISVFSSNSNVPTAPLVKFISMMELSPTRPAIASKTAVTYVVVALKVECTCSSLLLLNCVSWLAKKVWPCGVSIWH